MRLALAAAFVCLCAPVWAQQPAPKPQAQNLLAASYAALPEAERSAIQTDLIWTGDYNGIASADFGDRAITAVKAFQKRLGVKETGVLNPQERQKLADAARRKREAVGWRVVDDPLAAVRLGIPSRLVTVPGRGDTGSRWASAKSEVSVETFRAPADTTLPSAYEQQRALPGRKITYSVLRADFFVVAGLQELQKFYVRAQINEGVIRGMAIRYDQALEGTMDPVVIAMSSAFANFAKLAPRSRQKVEYGTAVNVSPAGHFVTSAALLDGCQTLSLAGVGPADIVASDKQRGVALLQVFGARDLKPVSLGPNAAPGEMSVAGIEAPQAQGGGSAVSLKTARVASVGKDTTSMDGALPAGFVGAAVMDRGGALAGIVIGISNFGTARADITPAAAIGDFLAQQRVTQLASAGSRDDVRAAVRRLICVRK